MNENKIKEILEQKQELPPLVEERLHNTYQLIRNNSKSFAPEVKNRVHRRNKCVPLLVSFAVILVLACSVAAASELGLSLDFSFFKNWLHGGFGANEVIMEEMLDTEPAVTYEEDKPVLTIQQLYVDGTYLVFTAIADEFIDYTLSAKDHIYVNGIDCLNMGFTEIEKGSGQYQCTVKLSENVTGDILDVLINLYTEDGIQEFSFAADISGMDATRSIPDQLINGSFGTVKVTDISFSPSLLTLNLSYLLSDEPDLDTFLWLGYDMKDNNGTLYQDITSSSSSSDPYQVSDSKWHLNISLEIRGFSYQSDSITLIPYTMEKYSSDMGPDYEGKFNPDTKTLHEELEFTIKVPDSSHVAEHACM